MKTSCRLLLGLWTMVVQVATAVDCPPFAILGDIEPEPGECSATDICISEDGMASVLDSPTSSEISCAKTIIALRCSYKERFAGCTYSILESEPNGAMKQTCCIEVYEQAQYHKKLQQIPFGSADEGLGFEVPIDDLDDEDSDMWEDDQWNDEELEGLGPADGHWELQGNEAELPDEEYFEPKGDEEGRMEGEDEEELDDAEGTELDVEKEGESDVAQEWEQEGDEQLVLQDDEGELLAGEYLEPQDNEEWEQEDDEESEPQDDEAELPDEEYLESKGDEQWEPESNERSKLEDTGEWEPEDDEGLDPEFDENLELDEEDQELETEEYEGPNVEGSEDAALDDEDDVEEGSEEIDELRLE